MRRKGNRLFVCKNCGAVERVKKPHCGYCGAVIGDDKLILKVTDGSAIIRKGTRLGASADSEKPKKVTTLSILSLIFGILAVYAMTGRLWDGGILVSVAALVLAIINFCQKRGGTVLAAIGLGLGIYVLFWSFFWIFLSAAYYF